MADYNLGTARGTIEIGYKPGGPDAASQDLDKVRKSAMSTDQALDKTARTAGIVGTALAGGLAVAVNSAANFEQRLDAVAAVSGATADEMDRISEKALQLGKDTAFSATESASAIEELVKAGLSVEDVLNGAADATVNLAAAGEVAMPEAAAIASNAMNQFNLAAEDMPKIADSIAGAANASAIDVGDFGQSLGQVGAVANLAGLSFQDTAVAIAEMGNAGIKGSDAGTSLKSMLSRLQPTTKKQSELMRELGLLTEDGTNKFYDQEGRLKNLSSLQETLKDSLSGMTQQQKQAALQTLFGSDAIRAAAVLADEGAAGYDKMAGAMGKVSAADVAAGRMDNLKGKVEELKGSAETLAIQLGTLLIPAITTVVEKVGGAVDWFTQLSDSQQKIIVAAAGLSGGLLLGVAALIKIVQFAKAARLAFAALRLAMISTSIAASAMAGFAALSAGAAGATTGATLFTKTLNLLGKAIRPVLLGIRLLGIALVTNPIGIIIAAIIALVAVMVLLYKKNETVRNAINAVWAGIKSAIGAVVDWLTGTALPAILSVWNGIVASVQAFVGVIRAVFTGLLAFWTGVWNMFGPTVMAVWELIKAIVGLGFAVVRLIVMTGVLALVAVFRAGWNAIRTATSVAWNAIKAVVGAVVGALRAVVGPPLAAVRGAVSAAWGAVRSATSSVWNGLKSTVSGAINGIVTLAKGIKAKVLAPFSGAATWLVDAGKKIIDGLLDGINKVIGKVTDKLKALTDKIPKVKGPERRDKKLLEPAGRYIMEGLDRSMTDGAKQVLQNLSRMNTDIPATINPTLGGAIDLAAAVDPLSQLRYSSDKAARAKAAAATAGMRLYGELDLSSRSTATVKGMAAEVADSDENFEKLVSSMGDRGTAE